MAIFTLLYQLGIIVPATPRAKESIHNRLERPIRDAFDSGTLPEADVQVILDMEHRRQRKHEARCHEALTRARWLYFYKDVIIVLALALVLLLVVYLRTVHALRTELEDLEDQRKQMMAPPPTPPFTPPMATQSQWEGVPEAKSLAKTLVAGLYAVAATKYFRMYFGL